MDLHPYDTVHHDTTRHDIYDNWYFIGSSVKTINSLVFSKIFRTFNFLILK